MIVFIRYPFNCEKQMVDFENVPVSADCVKGTVEDFLGNDDFLLEVNGRKLHGKEIIPCNSTVHVIFSLPGGKGGFGSMLRAIGAQIEKTTNREACRDLSGRRLRDINEEQRLKKWISKEAEREAEKIKRRKARIERLKTKAPHNFFDFEYEKQIAELPDRISEALNEGLEKAKHSKKRPHEKSEGTALPKKSWLSEDMPLTSSDSDSDDINAVGESSPSKKPKIASNDSANCDSNLSESFQPQPCSSKDCAMEESLSNDTDSTFTDAKSEESVSNSDKANLLQQEESSVSSSESVNILQEENKKDCAEGVNLESSKTEKSLVSNKSNSVKEPEIQDNSPINLLDFESISDLEALGLDRLKSALMSRGLKCGGNLHDRAQRLWKIRDLQPDEYPANLLAKSKK